MNANNTTSLTKLALLIDGDNVSATYMPLIMREAAKIGEVAIRRIYGQFNSGRMKSWLKHLDEYDLTAVNVAPLTHGKNATDMKLVIEAMDMLHGRQLDGFCIASSDGDFTPLVARVRGNALGAYGFGAKKAPAAYKASFDRFYECDTLVAAEKKTGARKVAPPQPKPAAPPAPRSTPRPAASRATAPPQGTRRAARHGPEKEPVPTAAILAAIDDTKGDDGWSHLGAVNNAVRKAIKDFSSKKYGYATLKRLIGTMSDIETKTLAGGTALVRRAVR